MTLEVEQLAQQNVLTCDSKLALAPTSEYEGTGHGHMK